MDDAALERLEKINRIAEEDGEYCRMQAEYRRFERDFTKFVNRLPRKYRNFLWGYPGMAYLMSQRKLMLACAHMEFPAEQE